MFMKCENDTAAPFRRKTKMIDDLPRRGRLPAMNHVWMPIVLTMFLLGSGGCSKKPKKNPMTVTKADVAKPVADITEAEAEQFGKALAEALHQEQSGAFRRMWDGEQMFYRIFPKDVVDARPELKSTLPVWSGRVAQQMYANLVGHRVEVLRSVRDTEGVKIRLRLVAEGMNYWDVLLGRDARGRVQGVDYVDYTSGDSLSESQRRLFQQLMPNLISGKVNRAQAAQEMQNVQELKELITLFHQGKFQEFLDRYDRLNPTIKTQRSIMHFRVMAANDVAVGLMTEGKPTGGIYAKAVDEYRINHPDAWNLELLLIDYHFLKNEYAKALNVIDALDKRIGGDPYLDLFRGNAHYSMDDHETARRFLVKVEQAYSWDQDVYDTLLEIALDAKEFKEVTRILIAKETHTNYEWDPDFNGIERFDAYRASPELAKWKAYQAEKP